MCDLLWNSEMASRVPRSPDVEVFMIDEELCLINGSMTTPNKGVVQRVLYLVLCRVRGHFLTLGLDQAVDM